MTPRGRRIALAALALGLLTLAGAGFACRGWMVEEWWLWKLGSRHEEERQTAAKRLGELKSVRAIPNLLSAVGERQRDFFWHKLNSGVIIPDEQSVAFGPVIFRLVAQAPPPGPPHRCRSGVWRNFLVGEPKNIFRRLASFPRGEKFPKKEKS